MGLYHYTCDHGRAGIQRDGWVKPGPDGLVWLTDLGPDVPRRERVRKSLGLTSYSLKCDRMEFVFEVESEGVLSYHEAVQEGRVSRTRHMMLTRLPAARPSNWYVAAVPVAVL